MILFLPSKSGVSVSPSPRSPAVKSLWPSKPDSLGILSPFVRSPVWENGCVAQNLHNNGKTSLVLFSSSLWLAYLVVWDLILSLFFPSYHLTVASPLSFDVGYLFLVGSNILLSMVVQQLVAILVLLQWRWVHILLFGHLEQISPQAWRLFWAKGNGDPMDSRETTSFPLTT